MKVMGDTILRLLFAIALMTGACGDDPSSDDETGTATDTARDAGVVDSGVQADTAPVATDTVVLEDTEYLLFDTDTYTGPRRVMPIGDSTTATGCWRARLWEKIDENGYEIDFVGSMSSPPSDCSSPNYDSDHEGYSGELVTNQEATKIEGWFAANQPDILLLHFATNDLWNGVSTTKILEAYSLILEKARVVSPRVTVLVAQVIPLDPKDSDCPSCPTNTTDLNDAIPDWAAGESSAASPVIVVDQWTGFNLDEDTYDGVHPYPASGTQKIADKWYEALVPLL